MFTRKHHTDFKENFKNTKAVWWFHYCSLIANFDCNLNSTDIMALNSSFKVFSQMTKNNLGGLPLNL